MPAIGGSMDSNVSYGDSFLQKPPGLDNLEGDDIEEQLKEAFAGEDDQKGKDRSKKGRKKADYRRLLEGLLKR